MKIGRIAKAVVAAVGGLATALSPVVADEVVGLDEVGTVSSALALAVATVYGVWRTPNREADDRLTR